MPSFFILTAFIAVGTAAAAYEPQKCNGRSVEWIGGHNFEWPCSITRNLYKSSGRFVGKNVIATRAAVYKDEAFLALPRYRSGVPATLAKVNLKNRHCQASLEAFPCWSIQEEGNCGALQNVVDLFLDQHGVLWVLDSGITNSLEQPVRRCPPKVVAVNARTGKLVKTVDIKPLTSEISRLQYIVADYSKDGRVFIYISDAASRAILVFDVTSDRGYRVILPKDVTLGCTRRDVLYMTLIRLTGGENSLLFTYLSSKHLFSIKTAFLQSGYAHGRVELIAPKKEKLVFLGTDNGSSVFFRKEGESDVYKWDVQSNAPMEAAPRVYKGSVYALPTQVMPDYKRSRMRVLESNFPDFFQGTVGCGVNQSLKVF